MKTKHCTMPECPDFPVKGNRWCAFHIKELHAEFSEFATNGGKKCKSCFKKIKKSDYGQCAPCRSIDLSYRQKSILADNMKPWTVKAS